MKSEWWILIISALTDAIINGGTAITTAMVATGSAQMPSTAVLILAGVGALVSGARTIQQALKSTATVTAALRGDPTPRG